MGHQHPYYPVDVSLPGYQPLVIPFEKILTFFFSTFAIVIVGTWLWTGTKKHLSTKERLLCCWFLCSGLIHFIVEGTVVANSKFYEDTSGNILNEIWKEYSKADSRYATRDAFIVQMEGVTAWLWGPACLLIVYGIVSRAAWRFSAIMLVSWGQLYGDVLYYLTCWHEGLGKHSRPEPLYFWFYFVGMNAIWIVVPILCTWYAASNSNKAVAALTGSGKKKLQ